MIWNPFAPGPGTMPPFLAGREAFIAAVESDFERVETGRGAALTAFIGIRGVGKTVLLNHLVDVATSRGWVASRVSASDHPDTDSIVQILASRPDFFTQPAIGGAGKAAAFEAMLDDLSLDARRAGTGVLFAVDELQACSQGELETFAQITKKAKAKNLPIMFIFAGLTTAPKNVRKVNASAFGELVQWVSVPFLTKDQTSFAIQEPLTNLGLQIDAEALAILVDYTNGYPFVVQLAAKLALAASGEELEVTMAHVQASVAPLVQDLAEGVYGATWSRAAPGERRFLYALAVAIVDSCSDEVASGEVYRRLGLDAGQVSAQRARLVDKGIIETCGRRVGFTLPSFASFVVDHQAALELDTLLDLDPPKVQQRSFKFVPRREVAPILSAAATDIFA